MKEIKAIIRPNKLPVVHNALMALPGFPGMAVSKVEGCSAPDRHVVRHTVKDELTEYSPKIRIDIVAPDDQVDTIFQLIMDLAGTGHVGDGLVWVTDVAKVGFVFKDGQGR